MLVFEHLEVDAIDTEVGRTDRVLQRVQSAMAPPRRRPERGLTLVARGSVPRPCEATHTLKEGGSVFGQHGAALVMSLVDRGAPRDRRRGALFQPPQEAMEDKRSKR